jgi:hypothetical protein
MAAGLDVGWTGQVSQFMSGSTSPHLSFGKLDALTRGNAGIIPTISITTDGTCSVVQQLPINPQDAAVFCNGKPSKNSNTAGLRVTSREFIGGRDAAGNISSHADLLNSLPKPVMDQISALSSAGAAFIIDHVGNADNKVLLNQITKSEQSSGSRAKK